MSECSCCRGECKPKKKDSGLEYNIVRLILSGILFASALILKNNLYLFILSFALSGYNVIVSAIKNIAKGKIFDENFLMTIATIGAFVIKEYPEGAAVMLFYQIGELLQDASVERSKKSITALLNIRPDYACLSDGKRVLPENVNIGDIIIVKPGERIPLDGKVLSGSASIDTSSVTGESLPRYTEEGDDVISGSVCINGVLNISVTKEYHDSTVAKILELTQNANSKKSVTEKFITRFAKVYTPIVTISAALIAIFPPIILHREFSPWIYKALIFLVVSCPCALVISIPLGFFGGIGRASKNGILVKGSNFLESLCNIDTVVFDKTGTLTKGSFRVNEIKSSYDNLLELAAYAEANSNHPIAQSIVKAYNGSIDKNRISKFEEISGQGIRVLLDGNEVLAGNNKLIPDAEDTTDTAVHISVNGKYAGYITVSDEIKPDAKTAISNLKSMGIKSVVMLTGDNRQAGEKVADELGIDKAFYSLLPQDKAEKLDELKKTSKVCFVGDGINDSPVLALADVGIAMGGLGSDAAVEASDVVIMTDEPSKVAQAINIGKMTKAVVWQNIIFSLGIKGLVLLLATLGFASMWYAVFADVGVALLAVLNSIRLIFLFKNHKIYNKQEVKVNGNDNDAKNTCRKSRQR